MALAKYSKFYYGFKIDDSNNMLEFSDSTGVHVGELKQGSYTLASLVAEVVRTLNAAGGQVYLFSVVRDTRIAQISATNIFTILSGTGAYRHVSAWTLLGFSSDSDYEDANVYFGETGCGKEYCPQFPLQSYSPTSSNSQAIGGVRKETATGIVEAVSFGRARKMECEMLFITDIPQTENFIIRSNDNGYADACAFLDYATELLEVEFMEDEANPDAFEVLVLESTEEDQNGQAYKLKEEVDENLPGYWKTGNLKWNLRS